MGCTNSKLDDLPAVALCRERCNLLDEAMRERYALAQAHRAYVHSLKEVGHSLQTFLEEVVGVSGSPPSLKLNLPTQKKGDDVENTKVQVSSPQSNSGSHLHFQSDSDDDDGGDSDFHHDSPLHTHTGHIDYMGGVDQGKFGSFNGGYVHMNYMKNEATPSLVYEQRPVTSETVRIGESSSSSFYQYPYQSNNSMPYPYYGHPNYSGYYGSSSPPRPTADSSSKPPPPPPSPPRASAWDFFNPFESYDKFYPAYTPSRNSKDLREEEGIPDLEEDDLQQEVVKEVQEDHSLAGNNSKRTAKDQESKDEDKEPSVYQAGPSRPTKDDGLEYEVHVVDKKVVEDEGKAEERRRSKGSRDVFDVAREIEIQFKRASESGNEVAKLLEVGRLPYNRKHVSSKMLQMVTPSLPVVSSRASTSKSVASSSPDKGGPGYMEIGEDVAMRAKNLSATLQKLYLWEKKLHNEVKAEEKMRITHDRKRRKLKRLDERGAEAPKVDSTRTLIRNLSTKMRIAIQVVERISVTINKIRDEELWPQLNELIKGLTRMYRCMLECHRTQCQVIMDARGLGPTGSGKKLSDDHLEATLCLERELINWTFRFYSWVQAQKSYVRALNGWLLKCLLYEPEETLDGIAPFSPGRIGAPPVFVICNQWSQALERISEKEVVDSMRVFANDVLQLWEQDKLEMRQRMMANKDLETKVKFLDKKDQKVQKEFQALDKKLIMGPGNGYSLSVPVYQSDTSKSNIQASLQRIFEAMERFIAESTKAYDDLLQRSEEETLRAREGKIP